jgi:hypothetical protein
MSVYCMNCDAPASYTVGGFGAEPSDYCSECLPTHYRVKAADGLYGLVEPVFNALDPTSKKSSKKTAPAAEADASESN